MAKHSPTLTTTIISGLCRRAMARIMRGTTSRPITTRPTRKAASRPIEPASMAGERPSPVATAVRMAMSRMAIRSSTIRIADDDLAQLAGHALLVERLGDDRGARDGDDGAGEQALARGPAERLPGHVAEPDHDAGLDHGGDAGGRPDPDQAAEAELEPEREHQEDHAQLGERLDDLPVGEQRDRHARTDDEPGQDVAEHHRLPEPLEQDRRDARRAQHDRQGDEKGVRVVHGPPLVP